MGGAHRGLPENVRRAALRAFDESLQVVPLSSRSIASTSRASVSKGSVLPVASYDSPVLGERTIEERRFPWIRIAALLLLALGTVSLWIGSTPAPAEAGLALQRVGRLSHRGAVWALPSIEPARMAAAGEAFAPQRDEWVSVGLTHDSMVVVGNGDRVRVVPVEEVLASLRGFGEAGSLTQALVSKARPGRGMLRLESGEARIACKSGESVWLAVGTAGVLVVDYGAAHIVLESGLVHSGLHTQGSRRESVQQGQAMAGAVVADVVVAEGESAPMIALAPRSRAEFFPAAAILNRDGSKGDETNSAPESASDGVVLCAGARVLVSGGGVEAVGAADLSLFRELRSSAAMYLARWHSRAFTLVGSASRASSRGWAGTKSPLAFG